MSWAIPHVGGEALDADEGRADVVAVESIDERPQWTVS